MSDTKICSGVEFDRLQHTEERDGTDRMLGFCEQLLAAYVNDSINQGRHKESIKHAIQVLGDHGRSVIIVATGARK